jgi:hypothetical protein
LYVLARGFNLGTYCIVLYIILSCTGFQMITSDDYSRWAAAAARREIEACLARALPEPLPAMPSPATTAVPARSGGVGVAAAAVRSGGGGGGGAPRAAAVAAVLHARRETGALESGELHYARPPPPFPAAPAASSVFPPIASLASVAQAAAAAAEAASGSKRSASAAFGGCRT